MAEHEKTGAPQTDDAHLVERVKDALLSGTESAGIDVQVSGGGGASRLHGVVDALSHKRAAEEIARRVPGVRRVDNDIAVANEETYSDKDIEEALTRKLEGKDETRGIGCRVRRGAVTLVGHAPSQEDVEEAVRLAEDTAGVREVRVERIKVGEGTDEDDAGVSREAIRHLQKMGYDPQQFQVYCDAGVLYLKGFVPTRRDRSRIKAAMHRIPGVHKVDALLVTDDQMGGEIH